MANGLGILGMRYAAMTGYAAVTGPKYNVTANGIISANGLGEGYFPGNSAGYAGTGGQYV
jgi:hypothetical protein